MHLIGALSCSGHFIKLCESMYLSLAISQKCASHIPYTVLGFYHFASRLFNCILLYSQDEVCSDMLREAISKIKRVLEKMDPSSSGAGKMVSSTFHLIATHPRTGLTCCRLSQDQAALQCGFLTPDDLEALVTGAVNLFKQVGLHHTCFTLPLILYIFFFSTAFASCVHPKEAFPCVSGEGTKLHFSQCPKTCSTNCP